MSFLLGDMPGVSVVAEGAVEGGPHTSPGVLRYDVPRHSLRFCRT